jgi:hypothetical protein
MPLRPPPGRRRRRGRGRIATTRAAVSPKGKVFEVLEGNGGRSRIRTYDPLIKSQLLYQLSYAPARPEAVVCLGGEARNIRKESWNARDYFLARRDISGAVDFAYLEGFALDDSTVIDEVLALFREQAALWTPMLDKSHPGWMDAVHTVKGAARGVGAFTLGDVCAEAEAGTRSLGEVRNALDAALMDIAAYAHERALRSLKG